MPTLARDAKNPEVTCANKSGAFARERGKHKEERKGTVQRLRCDDGCASDGAS